MQKSILLNIPINEFLDIIRGLIRDEMALALENSVKSPYITSPTTEDDLLTTAQVASLLKSCTSTVNNYRKAGHLNPYPFGGKILFQRSEVMAFAKQKGIKALSTKNSNK